jgi:hypothetical protein
LRSGVGVERIGPPRESSKTRAATRKEIITQLKIVGCEPASNAVGSTRQGDHQRNARSVQIGPTTSGFLRRFPTESRQCQKGELSHVW